MNEREDELIKWMQSECEKMERFVAANEDLKQVLAYNFGTSSYAYVRTSPWAVWSFFMHMYTFYSIIYSNKQH